MSEVGGKVIYVRQRARQLGRNKMKFYIRRAVAGVIAVPVIACAWVAVYFMLLVIGGEPQQTIADTFQNGLLIGWVCAVAFTFAPQFNNLVNKIAGE